jgi:hypothetical protein
MSQRTRILSQIAGFRGWKVSDSWWESASGERVEAVRGFEVPVEAILVLRMARRWAPRCGRCLAIMAGRCHERRVTEW